MPFSYLCQLSSSPSLTPPGHSPAPPRTRILPRVAGTQRRNLRKGRPWIYHWGNGDDNLGLNLMGWSCYIMLKHQLQTKILGNCWTNAMVGIWTMIAGQRWRNWGGTGPNSLFERWQPCAHHGDPLWHIRLLLSLLLITFLLGYSSGCCWHFPSSLVIHPNCWLVSTHYWLVRFHYNYVFNPLTETTQFRVRKSQLTLVEFSRLLKQHCMF